MQISTGTESSRDLIRAIDNLIYNTLDNINGTPDIVFLGITASYKDKRIYEKAINRIRSRYGKINLIGGTFPGVGTSGEYPTTKGCAALALKSNEIRSYPPQKLKNIRLHPNRAAKEISNQYKKISEKSKITLFFSPGPCFEPDAIDGMKILGSTFATKAKRLFNFVGNIIEKQMAKKGYGATNYIVKILKSLAKYNISNIMGIATMDLDIRPNYQFVNDRVFDDAITSISLASDTIKFAQAWTFDSSEVKKSYQITDFLDSGYIQRINRYYAKEEFLKILDIPEDIYSESFKRYNYASLLYLSALEVNETPTYIPFVSACYPQLTGIVSSLPSPLLEAKKLNAKLFTQSGIGIQKSALNCGFQLKSQIKEPLFGIFFNCSNRLLIAGDKIYKEIQAIQKVLGDMVPFITFYGGGEFSIINNNPICSSASIHGMIAGR